jgi:hypothetical protein
MLIMYGMVYHENDVFTKPLRLIHVHINLSLVSVLFILGLNLISQANELQALELLYNKKRVQ